MEYRKGGSTNGERMSSFAYEYETLGGIYP